MMEGAILDIGVEKMPWQFWSGQSVELKLAFLQQLLLFLILL